MYIYIYIVKLVELLMGHESYIFFHKERIEPQEGSLKEGLHNTLTKYVKMTKLTLPINWKLYNCMVKLKHMSSLQMYLTIQDRL